MKLNFSIQEYVISLTNQIHKTIVYNFSENPILEIWRESVCDTKSHLTILRLFVCFS